MDVRVFTSLSTVRWGAGWFDAVQTTLMTRTRCRAFHSKYYDAVCFGFRQGNPWRRGAVRCEPRRAARHRWNQWHQEQTITYWGKHMWVNRPHFRVEALRFRGICGGLFCPHMNNLISRSRHELEEVVFGQLDHHFYSLVCFPKTHPSCISTLTSGCWRKELNRFWKYWENPWHTCRGIHSHDADTYIQPWALVTIYDSPPCALFSMLERGAFNSVETLNIRNKVLQIFRIFNP